MSQRDRLAPPLYADVCGANELAKPHTVSVSDESRASQRWYPEGRTAQMWFGGGFALLGLLQTFSSVGEAASWVVLAQMCMILAGIGLIVASRMSRVEASGQGLRIVKPPSRDRVIAWHHIVEVRREPPNTWSSKLGVVLDDGDVVDLRLSADDRSELLERWWLETGR